MIEWSLYHPDQVRKVVKTIGLRIAGDVPDNIVVFCPYHSNRRTPSAEISKTNGTFFCFACQETATLVDLVMFVAHVKYFEAVRLINKYKEPTSVVDAINALIDPEPKFSPFEPVGLIESLNQNALNSQKAICYFEGRGISINSIKRYSLGYSLNQDMVIFPVSNPDGEFWVGFQARSIEGKTFKNSMDLPKSKTLFNIQNTRWENEVFVTESPIDAIRMEQVGYPALSTMGANPSELQIKLLCRYFNVVYLVADNDNAGKASATKTLQKLGSRGIMVLPPEGYKDIGDMPDEEIQTLAQRATDPIGILEQETHGNR